MRSSSVRSHMLSGSGKEGQVMGVKQNLWLPSLAPPVVRCAPNSIRTAPPSLATTLETVMLYRQRCR